ncbi:PRC and DUF2382 domain-containing protein [Amycolatopsis sp. 195334CR]|uniref:PRC and DUF2382 domain-containing protein n=1 Tax=Amycolatopsis sp. 195334CR TaxID=2814588 RepID=UPI001A8E0E12|nr:PRC and DUF2382 domain-containing protein [Amycolatopsis sp. 195334CR]MBN6034823.1 PRC and DUF2382 domain-containing protein [Amycolatopsis sp. 195334CR]
MTGTMRPQDLIDSPVVDPAGTKIGKVGTVYLSDDTHQPEWVTVKTGLFGHRESFVPLSGADLANDGLHVQVDKEQVTDAPQIDADGHLSPEDSGELYRYYGLPMQRDRANQDHADRQQRGEQAAMGGVAGTAGMAAGKRGTSDKRMADEHDRSAMTGDRSKMAGDAGRSDKAGMAGDAGRSDKAGMAGDAGRSGKPGVAEGGQAGMAGKQGAAGGKHEQREAKHRGGEEMIRSEERFNVGTEEVETGHVRLRKYVVTEEQQVSVPVSHEEVRIEREPITDGEPGGAKIGEAEQDVVLHAEKPVVRKEAVPVERVRLGTERVTETETVSGELRKEQIEIDDDTKHRKNR